MTAPSIFQPQSCFLSLHIWLELTPKLIYELYNDLNCFGPNVSIYDALASRSSSCGYFAHLSPPSTSHRALQLVSTWMTFALSTRVPRDPVDNFVNISGFISARQQAQIFLFV